MSSTKPSNAGNAADLSGAALGAIDAARMYFQSRAEILRIESKQAARVWGKVAAALALILFLLASAYVIAMVAAIALVARATGIWWVYVALGGAALHLLVALVSILLIRRWTSVKLFRHTAASLHTAPPDDKRGRPTSASSGAPSP